MLKREMFELWDANKCLAHLESGRTLLFNNEYLMALFSEYAKLNEYNIVTHRVSLGFLVRLETNQIRRDLISGI